MCDSGLACGRQDYCNDIESGGAVMEFVLGYEIAGGVDKFPLFNEIH